MMNISALLQTQFAVYQGTSDNSFLRIKLAQAERLEKEQTAIREKYDGAAGKALEAKMTAASDLKVVLANSIRDIESALKRTIDIRTQFAAMSDAVAAGSADSWDYAISNTQYYAGSTALDAHNLAGSSRTSSAGFNERQQLVDAGSIDVTVSSHFLGSEYTIELSDGTVMRADQKAKTLSGGSHSFSFANLSVSALNGDDVTFTDAASGQTLSGTLHRGGNGLLNAWLYNNFDNSKPTAGLDRAKADIQAGNHYVSNAELDWGNASAMLEGAVKKVGTQFDQARTEFEKVSYEELDAKSAELKAAKTRFDITMNTLNLTRSNATSMIQQMFMTDTSYSSSSIYDIMSSA